MGGSEKGAMIKKTRSFRKPGSSGPAAVEILEK
jgi:hypothetical protein